MLLHHTPTQYPARAARQWIPPSIPSEVLARGSCPVSRQNCSPVDPAEYRARAARQWIPPSIPPEQLPSGSRPASRQSWACQWIPPNIPPERLASGSRHVSRQSGSPADPAEYLASLSGGSCEVSASFEPERSPVFASIPPEQLASLSKRADGNFESKSLGC